MTLLVEVTKGMRVGVVFSNYNGAGAQNIEEGQKKKEKTSSVTCTSSKEGLQSETEADGREERGGARRWWW